MKSLRTLLKVARSDLETLRRALSDQVTQETSVQDRTHGHEQTFAPNSVRQRDYESARAYGGYAVAALAIRRALDAERVMVQPEIERLRTLIADAHVEVAQVRAPAGFRLSATMRPATSARTLNWMSLRQSAQRALPGVERFTIRITSS